MIQSEKRDAVMQILQTRLFAYDLLRRTFLQEPAAAYLHTVLETGFIRDFPFSEESELIAEGIDLISRFGENIDLNNQETFNRLHWDYTRMFVGPGKLPAPPWESAYLNDQKMLFQKETLEVRQSYIKYGLLPINYKHDADDHLGLELDFMFHLANMTLVKAENNESTALLEIIEDSRLFLLQHLLEWVPALCKDIKENSRTDFYKGMSALLLGYLQTDLKTLEELSECCQS